MTPLREFQKTLAGKKVAQARKERPDLPDRDVAQEAARAAGVSVDTVRKWMTEEKW